MNADVEIQVSSFYSGKKILVTGAGGYLASKLVARLREVDCTVIRVSRKPSLPGMAGRIRLEDVQGNVGDRSLWERLLEGVDVVCHFAAQTSVYVAEQDPELDWKTNVLPMLNLLEACKEKGRHPIVAFAGTVTEVGIPTSLPVNEEPKDLPVTVYDMHKLWAEQYLGHYVREGVVRGATLRLSNVYGPGPRSSSADRGIINLMMARAVKGETLTIYGTGDCLRDYVFIDDVVDAFLRVPVSIERVNGRHFVIGSGTGHSIAEAIGMVADRVAVRTSHRVPVVHVEPPGPQSPIESRNFVADTRQFGEATGWRARCSLEEGIDRTLDGLIKG